MARSKASDVSWEKVEVLGKECLFVDIRIDRNSIPEGYSMYEVRHADEDWGEPAEICLGVLVNFFGTLLTKDLFTLESSTITNNAYLWLDDGDWNYLNEFVKL